MKWWCVSLHRCRLLQISVIKTIFWMVMFFSSRKHWAIISSDVPLLCVHLPSVVPSKRWDLDSLNLLFLCFSFPSLCSGQGGLWKAVEATPVALPQSSRSPPLSSLSGSSIGWVLCSRPVLCSLPHAYSCVLVAPYSLFFLRLLIICTLKSYSDCCLFKTFFEAQSVKCTKKCTAWYKFYRFVPHITTIQIKIDHF